MILCEGDCNLEKEPWRWNFTGPKCECGLPTPGTDKERQFHVENKVKNTKFVREQVGIEDKTTRQDKINELYTKNGLLND